MSNQVSIDAELVKYLQATGYRSDPIINKLVEETLALGMYLLCRLHQNKDNF